MRKYIEICRIVNTHGINGTVKAESWCDSPKILCGMKKLYIEKDGQYRELKVARASVQKRMALITFEEYKTIEEALRLKGTVLYADRDDIPIEKGAHLIDDLKGLCVIDADTGKIYGTLKDVLSLGASDIYEINTEKGIAMIPAVDEFVIRIDLDKGIFIRPIEGMFE